ncbi:hypothetical protein STENM327S_01156 [Streptomyces tendae]
MGIIRREAEMKQAQLGSCGCGPAPVLCSLAGPADELAATDPERGRIALERQTTEPIRPDLLALFDKEELVKYLADEELEGLSE